MNELIVQPNVYTTGKSKSLISVLERVWLGNSVAGNGTIYLISSFANYNGGVRFFPIFRKHIENGGKVVAIFGGSAQQKLTSKQIVAEMLECGAEVSSNQS